MQRISDKIKAGRLKKSISIEELSSLTHISVTTLRKLENGQNSFQGDESYVKMYLRRIAPILDLDESELLDDHFQFTQELSLQKIQEEQERVKLSNTTKIPLTFNKQPIKPKHVYEDNYISRYIKYFIIVCLLVGTIFMVWQTLTFTLSNDEPPVGDVNDPSIDKDKDVLTDQKDDQKDDQEDETTKPQGDQRIEFTDIGPSDFEVRGLQPGDALKIEVTFSNGSAFNLFKGASQVEGAYKVDYKEGDVYMYETTFEPNINFTLNFWALGASKITVNGVEVPYKQDQLYIIDGVVYLRLRLKEAANEPTQ